jgi:hypothetical protein
MDIIHVAKDMLYFIVSTVSLAVRFGTDFDDVKNVIQIGLASDAYPFWHSNATAKFNLGGLERLFSDIVTS